jgi:hypothetical protein
MWRGLARAFLFVVTLAAQHTVGVAAITTKNVNVG